MSLYNTQIGFFAAWFPRFVQGFGLGSTFVALTTLTMSRISQEKMGNATGIFNLMRNLGGSFGIATATTLLSRRAQLHQSRLVEHLTPLSQPFLDWQHRLGQVMPDLGANWTGGTPPRPWAPSTRRSSARPRCWPSATITISSPSSSCCSCPWSSSCAASPARPRPARNPK